MSDTNSPQQPTNVEAQPTPIENPFQTPETYPQHPIQPQQKMGDQLGMRVLLPVGRSGWAIAAGYLGLLSVTLIIAPLAIIISVIAIMDIRKSRKTENRKHGMGRAIFGLVMGLAGSVGLLLFLMDGGFSFF